MVFFICYTWLQLYWIFNLSCKPSQFLVITASLLVLFLLIMPWSFLSLPFKACFGETKCFDCEGGNRRELIPDLNKNWQVNWSLISFIQVADHVNQLVEVARADCLASLAWLCAFCRWRQGRERRRAWCKARSQVSVRSQPKTNGFILSPYKAGMVHFYTCDNVTVSLIPQWASPLSPLLVGLGCSPPKPSLDWYCPFKFFHTNHWHLATP